MADLGSDFPWSFVCLFHHELKDQIDPGSVLLVPLLLVSFQVHLVHLLLVFITIGPLPIKAPFRAEDYSFQMGKHEIDV